MNITDQIRLFCAAGVCYALLGDFVGIYPLVRDKPSRPLLYLKRFISDLFYFSFAGVVCLLLVCHAADGVIRWYHLLPFCFSWLFMLPLAYPFASALRRFFCRLLVSIFRVIVVRPILFACRVFLSVTRPLAVSCARMVAQARTAHIARSYRKMFFNQYHDRANRVFLALISQQNSRST